MIYSFDLNSIIPADVTIQVKSSQTSVNILYEVSDKTKFLVQPIIGESNTLCLELNCRSIEQLLRTHFIIYVAPRRDSSFVDALSYENDSFLALMKLMQSSDIQTKVSAISAIGKLASYMTETGIVSKSSGGYRNRVINDKSIFDIITATFDISSTFVAGAAWKAISRILPNMEALLQLMSRIYDNILEEENSIEILTFFASWMLMM